MSKALFQQHIQHLQSHYEAAMQADSASATEAVLIHSGQEQVYFADDRAVPFQAFSHFCHWLPVNKPDQFLLIRAGCKPRYLQFLPQDFWHDQTIDNDPWWADCVEITIVQSLMELKQHLQGLEFSFLGESAQAIVELGIEPAAINPEALCHYLDYQRAFKTDYELLQLQQAVDLALQGHEAARQAFLEGASEYGIHMAYLNRCQILEHETPYTNIVALNEKAAILHYQHKRVQACDSNKVLLIDAGCRVHNYGSDITRTWLGEDVHAVFAELHKSMETLQAHLVATVAPGKNYGDLHEATISALAQLLLDLDIIRANGDQARTLELARLFMPHGVGHLLGIQVHDVGGHQRDSAGQMQAPPAHAPALRNTRPIEKDMVFTIEPGCYFIPMLLEPQRQTELGKCINWSLLEELYPLGGIRIEDNIRVTADGHENLSRPG
ncbi:MAG: Xaa-Pro dipeptidase [Pseudomonadales bacterium]|nr:Xaa-Pro dipeptidase [Pseudomonadales bacterium]